MSNVLLMLLEVSFRAGHVMSVLRHTHLFPRMIRSKGASGRFAVDPVTLADVLIQGMSFRMAAHLSPVLVGRVFGEEEDDESVAPHMRPLNWSSSLPQEIVQLMGQAFDALTQAEAELGISESCSTLSLNESPKDGTPLAAGAEELPAEQDRADQRADKMRTRAEREQSEDQHRVSGAMFGYIGLNRWTEDATLDATLKTLETLAAKDPEWLPSLAVWIDPLDGTNEYIQDLQVATPYSREASELDVSELTASTEDLNNYQQCTTSPTWSESLRKRYHRRNSYRELTPPVKGPISGPIVVCFLAGIFDERTGLPVIGVLHQPFGETLRWGVSVGDVRANNVQIERPFTRPRPRICISRAESPLVVSTLSTDFDLEIVPGCGYKLMMVVEGDCDAFVSIAGKVCFWDTCGPHAILRSLGGDIARLDNGKTVTYSTDRAQAVLEGGFVAFKDQAIGTRILELLQPIYSELVVRK